MKAISALVALAALSSIAYAEPTKTSERPAPQFTVIEADARLPFGNLRVNGYHVARDDSLILDAGPSRWYRATLWEPCARDLRWSYEHIGLDTRPNGTLDRFSEVIVRGHRCPIKTLDRIERPPRGASY